MQSPPLKLARRFPTPRRTRRGLAAGWLLIWSPIFLAMILLAIEVGNVMLAKSQLDNALEAAALAAVKEWKADDTDANTARNFGVSYASANTVRSNAVSLNVNDSCTSDVVVGTITNLGNCSQYNFTANLVPGANEAHAVVARRTLAVTPVCGDLFGLPLGSFDVVGEAAAIFVENETPRLVQIQTFTCP